MYELSAKNSHFYFFSSLQSVVIFNFLHAKPVSDYQGWLVDWHNGKKFYAYCSALRTYSISFLCMAHTFKNGTISLRKNKTYFYHWAWTVVPPVSYKPLFEQKQIFRYSLPVWHYTQRFSPWCLTGSKIEKLVLHWEKETLKNAAFRSET